MRNVRRTAALWSLFFALNAMAQFTESEVWLGDLDLSGGRFAVTNLRNISNGIGYDNQPAFYPDGSALLYSSEAEHLEETGLGVHAMRYDLATGRTTPMPKTRGFSPTPYRNGILTLREGQVWRHDAKGNPIAPLLAPKTVGYFTPIDEHLWVLFLNDAQRQIVIHDTRTGSVERMAVKAITAPYRVPGQRAVTFVDDAEGRVFRRLDVDAKKVEPLAEINFPTGGFHTWTPRNTILMASGGTIYEWTPGAIEVGKEAIRFDHPDLQGITRIALSPDQKTIALVSVPGDETVLQNARAASNAAFVRSVRGGASYVRTAESWDRNADGAVERGSWLRRWPTSAGPVELRGTYEVTWRRTVTPSGIASWRIVSERY